MRRDSIRTLRPGEPIPNGEPRRYPNSRGYIRLRWKVGEREYVETYEHRFIMQAKAGEEVHHVNRAHGDNRPENLEPLTPAEHGRRHRTIDWTLAVPWYEAGETTVTIAQRLKTYPGNVSRRLREQGVVMRRGNRRIPLDEERVAQLRASGMRPPAIAREMGVSRGPIDRVLRELGVPPGRPGRPGC